MAQLMQGHENIDDALLNQIRAHDVEAVKFLAKNGAHIAKFYSPYQSLPLIEIAWQYQMLKEQIQNAMDNYSNWATFARGYPAPAHPKNVAQRCLPHKKALEKMIKILAPRGLNVKEKTYSARILCRALESANAREEIINTVWEDRKRSYQRDVQRILTMTPLGAARDAEGKMTTVAPIIMAYLLR